MRPEQAEMVISLLDRVFKQLGADGGYDGAVKDVLEQKSPRFGVAMARGLLAALGENTLAKRLDGLLQEGKLPTREELKAELLRDPDLTPDDQAQLDRFKKIPQLFKAVLKKTTAEIRPSGGRPRKVSPADYPKICDEIATRLRTGQRVGNVVRAVAAQYNCNKWTIQKIWNDRARLEH